MTERELEQAALLEIYKHQGNVLQTLINASYAGASAQSVVAVRSLHFLNGGALFLLPGYISSLAPRAGTVSAHDLQLTIGAGVCFIIGNLLAALISHYSVRISVGNIEGAFKAMNIAARDLGWHLANLELDVPSKLESSGEHDLLTKERDDLEQKNLNLSRFTLFCEIVAWMSFTCGCALSGYAVLN